MEIKHFDDIVKITLHSVPDKPGIAAQIFQELGDHSINVELITHVSTGKDKVDVSFAMLKSDLDEVLNLLNKIKAKIGAKEVSYDKEVGIISVYGKEFEGKPGTAGKIFSALGKAGINIEMINTSFSSASCVISKRSIQSAIEAIEKEFKT